MQKLPKKKLELGVEYKICKQVGPDGFQTDLYNSFSFVKALYKNFKIVLVKQKTEKWKAG